LTGLPAQHDVEKTNATSGFLKQYLSRRRRELTSRQAKPKTQDCCDHSNEPDAELSRRRCLRMWPANKRLKTQGLMRRRSLQKASTPRIVGSVKPFGNNASEGSSIEAAVKSQCRFATKRVDKQNAQESERKKCAPTPTCQTTDFIVGRFLESPEIESM